jgi:phasin family protein
MLKNTDTLDNIAARHNLHDEDHMISFPEQLSTAQKAQFDTQIDFVRELAAQAFATAEQVLALNINTSRASAERAAGTVRQLFSVTDPRDLFTLGAHTQEELSALFNYGRELFGIASGARTELARTTAARPVPQPEPEPEPAIAVEQPLPSAQAAPAEEKPNAAPKARAPHKPDEVQDKPAAGPRGKAKPVAKALSKNAFDLPQPLAANIDSAEEPGVPLLDKVPPAADVLQLKQPAAGKAQRKKSARQMDRGIK